MSLTRVAQLKLLTFAFATLSLASVVHAQIRMDDPYLSGRAKYEKSLKETKLFEQLAAEQRGFVDVPLDYEDPSAGSTSIFYRLPKAFNAAQPTLLFFYGGPGITSLSGFFERTLPDFNVVYFDQRGTGFSYLPTLADQLTPRYFSSEHSARDAARVLDHLGIEKVGVYGHSYGSVVATIFAHLFNDRVSGVVLEGTIFEGTANSRADLHRIKLIQKVFDSLSPGTQDRILELSNDGELPKHWFSSFVKPNMYGPNFETSLIARIENLMKNPAASIVKTVREEIDESYLRVENIYFASIMHHQISCQELSLGQTFGGWRSQFNGRKLAPTENADALYCASIPGLKERSNRTFKASRYPIHAPVTYIQGTTDGATPVVGAIEHYRHVAKGSAHLFLVKNGGHNPAITELFESPETQWHKKERHLISAIVREALQGRKADSANIKALGWLETSK